MRHLVLGLFAALLTLMAWPSPAAAACAPERMVRIVTHVASPPAEPGSFGAAPKTLYRLGTKYGRVEELPNPATKLHLLIVVNEPDVWMVNRVDRTGRHIVDQGPTFNFRAPIFEKDGMPPLLRTLELGCERAFLAANNATPAGVAMFVSRRCELHTVTVADFRVTVCLGAGQKPMRASIHERGTLLFDMEYDSYEDELAPNLKLFERPAGVTFSEPAR
jgi:hypothetical protein